MARRRINQSANQRGYTFNELLVAMGIGVVAVLGYSLNSANVFRQQTASSNATIAIHLAQDKLEELQARRNPANENRCPNGGDHGIGANGGAGGAFDRCWQVKSSALGTNLKQLDVTVTWRDFEPRALTLSALVYSGS